MAPLFVYITIAINFVHSIHGHITYGNDSCVADWGKCGGSDYNGPTKCCNSRYFCNETDSYYSECVPEPLVPFPPAPASDWCGSKGMTLNKAKLAQQGVVNSQEIGEIWNYTT